MHKSYKMYTNTNDMHLTLTFKAKVKLRATLLSNINKKKLELKLEF